MTDLRPYASYEITWHVEPAAAMKMILSSVEELTRMKLAAVPHLCVENFSPQLFRAMMQAYYSDAGATVTPAPAKFP